ncbi:MAG: DNA gyrase inhibitor YacG [Parvibaculaceae bacterium]|jgi:endogenous inhibitor of DNA gyrase (YacG/DUF329 family)
MTGERPVRLRPRRPCPICAKPSQQKYHPFCSARCADVDLHRWLGGNYAIPAAEAEPDLDREDREMTPSQHPTKVE